MKRLMEMLFEAEVGSKTPAQVKQFRDFQRKGAEARKRAGGTGPSKPVATPKAKPKKKGKKKRASTSIGAKVGRAANGAAKATATSPIIKMFGG